MMCFRDVTYCASPNCKNECGRQLTEEIEQDAKNSKMLISVAYFCGVPETKTKAWTCRVGAPEILKEIEKAMDKLTNG